MIVITGATGNVGSSAIRHLVGSGEAVRAFVRDPDRARALLGEAVEFAVGDLGDVDSVRQAVRGATALLVSTADAPEKPTWETTLIDEGLRAGARRIVKVSTILAEAGSSLPPFDWHGRAEDHLRASEAAWSILRSTFYMTNVFASIDAIREQGVLPAAAADGRVAMVDPADTGAVAAAILRSEGHDGRTYTLTGPEAITWTTIAEELSAATGRPISFVDVSPEAVAPRLEAMGAPPWLVAHLPQAFALIRQGAMEAVTSDVRTILGREPRSFSGFARAHADVFAPVG